MTIFGKPLSEYLAFSKPLILLVLVTGFVRLGLSLIGTPNATTRWISMTAVMWIGVLYYSIRVHTSGFGSYKQLLPVLALPNLADQAVAIAGILIAIFTGNGNVFSAPEYAFGADGKTWAHVAAHVFVGTTLGSLVPWVFGCLFMFAAKRLFTGNRGARVAART